MKPGPTRTPTAATRAAPARPVSRGARLVLAPAVFVLALGVGVAVFAREGRWNLPPVPGDTQDYDNIALNLAHLRGFGHDWDDPEWRAPYEANNEADLYMGILARRGGFAPTAYRPPLLPLGIAAVYVFGRSFLVWGLVHIVLVALMTALAAGLAQRVAGTIPAVITTLLIVGDPALRGATVLSPYLTEGVTCLGVVLFAWALVRLAHPVSGPAVRDFALAGAALGVLALARSIFIFWYPPALVLVAGMAWRSASRDARPRRAGRAGGEPPMARAVRSVGAFLALSLLVPLPFWARNCVVLGRLMPLGTQGGRNLPLGWSDEALATGGVWTAESSSRWWATHGAGTEIGDPLTVETTQAAFGQREAIRWIRDHPGSIPRLAWGKLTDLWRRPFPGRFGWMLALFALVGTPLIRRRPELGILWAILAFESLAVMASYSDGVRFLIPVLPILDVLIAIGLWRLEAMISEALRRRAGARPAPAR